MQSPPGLRVNINALIVFARGFTYYKMSNLDNRISNADQLLTTDIDKFCESVTDVYSNVSKPALDIVLYVYRLTVSLGGKTPSILMLYLLISGVFLTRIRRPTGGGGCCMRFFGGQSSSV